VHTGKPTPQAYAAANGTLYFGVPTVWSRICAEPALASALSGARLVVSGSAPLPVAVFEQMQTLIGQAPVERYGMTETLITISTRADGERRPGWVGLPIDGVESRLVGDDGAAIDNDGTTIGELQIRATTMFEEYRNRPDATAASFDGDWFRTGDAAVIDNGGSIASSAGNRSTSSRPVGSRWRWRGRGSAVDSPARGRGGGCGASVTPTSVSESSRSWCAATSMTVRR
jgi:fatty acid CoA ligase FadD36